MKIYKGDMVKISVTQKDMNELYHIDPESYYYLEKYQGRVGQVFDMTTAENGYMTYHVNFGKEIGMFYGREVTLTEQVR